MPSLTSISHTSIRPHGITAQTTEFFDASNILVKKETHIFDNQKILKLRCVEDLTAKTITEFKPVNARNGIYAIKTVYDYKYQILSQGTADENDEYHGVISFFKPHKTRYEEYEHGKKINDLTHPLRQQLLKWGAIAITFGTIVCVYKCHQDNNRNFPDKDMPHYIGR